MKHRYLLRLPIFMALLLLGGGASAQIGRQNREYNPFRTGFQLAWHVQLSDQVKLIEIDPILDARRNDLLMLVDGSNHNDFRRKLLVTHWDGFRFANDSSIDFIGWSVDPLLAGRFHAPKPDETPPPEFAAPPAKTKKKAPAPPERQIVTAGGIYHWTGGTLVRLSAAPPNLKLALILEGSPDQMVINSGDSAAVYEAGDTEVHPSAYQIASGDAGYPQWGIGTQSYDGIKDYLPGIRYAQTYWKDRDRWQICLERGKPADLQDLPDATTGDTLIVYVPKYSNKDKTFWQLTNTDDYEEAWRSGPLPGRVLDVRVGDPKNEGKVGILVLTAENSDRERHLYFYTPMSALAGVR